MARHAFDNYVGDFTSDHRVLGGSSWRDKNFLANRKGALKATLSDGWVSVG